MRGLPAIDGQNSRRARRSPANQGCGESRPAHVPSLIVSAMPKSARSKRKNVRVLSSRIVFRGPVVQVTHDEVVEPSGIRAKRDIVRHPGSVVVLALDESGREPRVLLERQYRYAANSSLWELPAGRIDQGESELAAAKRELLEET